MTGPVEFLEAAHKQAEKLVELLPDGPWEWRGHNGPEGHYTALENRRGKVPVIRSHSGTGSSWLDWHDAFDAYLPEPEAVLRRVAADRKILAAHPHTTRVITGYGEHTAGFGCENCHNWDGVPEGRGNCATIVALAEGWGWTEETT